MIAALGFLAWLVIVVATLAWLTRRSDDHAQGHHDTRADQAARLRADANEADALGLTAVAHLLRVQADTLHHQDGAA
jgi:hypothetical protein